MSSKPSDNIVTRTTDKKHGSHHKKGVKPVESQDSLDKIAAEEDNSQTSK